MTFAAHVRFESGLRVDVQIDCCAAHCALLLLGQEMPNQYPGEKIVALTFKEKENCKCMKKSSPESCAK